MTLRSEISNIITMVFRHEDKFILEMLPKDAETLEAFYMGSDSCMAIYNSSDYKTVNYGISTDKLQRFLESCVTHKHSKLLKSLEMERLSCIIEP